MNTVMLNALDASIEKWEKRAETGSYISTSCALCIASDYTCTNCAVFECDKKFQHCNNTPYENWREHQKEYHPYRHQNGCPICKYLANKEVTFLKTVRDKLQNQEHIGSIIITTEKIVVRGEKCRKITKIKGVLAEIDLPIEYLTDDHIEWLNDHYIWCYSGSNITTGAVMHEKTFQDRVEYCRKAAARLHEINERLKRENADWYGKEVIRI